MLNLRRNMVMYHKYFSYHLVFIILDTELCRPNIATEISLLK